MDTHIKNLVFKGGGVLGIAYAGALQALNDKYNLDAIEGAAGTSAGSIVACLVALKYSTSEIKEIVAATNFKKFEDRWDPFRIPTKYGLYKGDYFLSWIKSIIAEKAGDPLATFEDLKEKGFLNLKVFATDLNEETVKEFSFDKTPNVVVAEAVRASMSIPFFFKAWKFSNGIPDRHLYVDGGTVLNYPIHAFGDLSTTLGFFLHSTKNVVSNVDYHHINHYVKSLFGALMNAQDIELERSPEEKAASVMINELGISAIDFDITKDEEQRLYNSGYQATIDYLGTRNMGGNAK